MHNANFIIGTILALKNKVALWEHCPLRHLLQKSTGLRSYFHKSLDLCKYLELFLLISIIKCIEMMMDKISIYATTMNVNKLNIPKFSQVRIVINHNFELNSI